MDSECEDVCVCVITLGSYMYVIEVLPGNYRNATLMCEV